MKTILFTNYYIDSNKDRQAELDFCFNENCKNFDEVIVICQATELPKEQKNVIVCISNQRPTFNDYFRLMPADSINVIANLDIVIPKETLTAAVTYFPSTEKRCLALTRYDGDVFYDHVDSQDTWIFKGQVNDVNADYGLGRAGIDNKIAYLIDQAGYEVLNPSLSLKTYHYHTSDIRNYIGTDIIPPPYKLLVPTI